MKPFIIGVAGGTASGKSSVCSRIIQKLGEEVQKQVVVITQDSFYKDLSPQENQLALKGEFNFDHPGAFDHETMIECMRELRNGRAIDIPKYDYVHNCRDMSDSYHVEPGDVILVEGILVFYNAELRDMFNMKLFVDTDPDTRLARRVERDIRERGRNLQQVLTQYLGLVKPAFEEFCLPTKKYADVIIPRGAENEVAIDLIVQHIMELLRSPRSTPVSNGHTVNTPANMKSPRQSRPH